MRCCIIMIFCFVLNSFLYGSGDNSDLNQKKRSLESVYASLHCYPEDPCSYKKQEEGLDLSEFAIDLPERQPSVLSTNINNNNNLVRQANFFLKLLNEKTKKELNLPDQISKHCPSKKKNFKKIKVKKEKF